MTQRLPRMHNRDTPTMPSGQGSRAQRNGRKMRDIIIVISASLLAFSSSLVFDFYERFSLWTRHLEDWELDEIPVFFFALSIACTWFAYRRLQDWQTEAEERRQAETSLRASEERYRTLVEGSLQGIAILQQGHIRFTNQRLVDLFGYDRAANLLGQPITLLMSPDALQDTPALWDVATSPVRQEWQGQRCDGAALWLASLLSPFVWEGSPGLLVTVQDITEQKYQEYAQQQIAYELHDGLAQLLVSAHNHLDAYMADGSLAAHPAARSLTTGMNALQRAIVETRRLLAGLRPVLLDTMGWVTAVQQHLAEVGQEMGWEVTCTVQAPDLTLSSAQEAALFRIVQEAISNARRHAETTRVVLSIEWDAAAPRTLLVRLQDWGKGFHPMMITASAQHFGLLSMQERTRQLGGTCVLESQPGQGTTVTIRLPLASALRR